MNEAICTLVGAIVGALIGFIASTLTLRYNYKKLYAETVSKNRMEWINIWRENLAIFLSCARILHLPSDSADKKTSDDKNIIDIKKQMYQAQAMITTRLNLAESSHQLIYAAILEIDTSSTNKNFNKQCAYIEETARNILKPEWERVKDEAKGVKR